MKEIENKKEFYYPSADGITQIHVIAWKPEGEIKAILQICHGMQEHIGRYEEFALYLASQGFYVVGNDHLGHGKSVASSKDYGFFKEKNGNEAVIQDIHTLRQKVEEKYPGNAYFMMGHSMGSFLLRQYITRYSEGLSGAIIMGTGSNPDGVLSFGMWLCRCISLKKGWHYQSKLVENMAVGSFNKSYKHPRTKLDWLSRNTENVDRYIADPMCGRIFTVNGYYNMFRGIKDAMKRENMNNILLKLPLLFVSGKEDPVGNFGRGVDIAFQQYQQYGFKDIRMILYPRDRHEILNEPDRKQIFKDLEHWMTERIEA